MVLEGGLRLPFRAAREFPIAGLGDTEEDSAEPAAFAVDDAEGDPAGNFDLDFVDDAEDDEAADDAEDDDDQKATRHTPRIDAITYTLEEALSTYTTRAEPLRSTSAAIRAVGTDESHCFVTGTAVTTD